MRKSCGKVCDPGKTIRKRSGEDCEAKGRSLLPDAVRETSRVLRFPRWVSSLSWFPKIASCIVHGDSSD